MSIKNKTWYERAKESIGQGYVTNSKNPKTDLIGLIPTHFSHGGGAFLYEHKGDMWIDLVAGLGAIHFGYANTNINIALSYVVQYGDCLSASSIHEVLAAEKIKELFVWPDKVKFVNDGTEACLAAIRMARAHNERLTICTEGYHGWSDEFTALSTMWHGTTKEAARNILKFDIDRIEETIPKFSSCVILEPVMLDNSEKRIESLKRLREYCTKYGIVLIFDEVITGLRYNKNSVATCHNVIPDLICCGKAFGNGQKVGFVAGKKDILDGNYFVSGTYFGHIPSLTAISRSVALSQHALLQSEDLNEASIVFSRKFNEIAPEIVKIEGWGSRGQFSGSHENVSILRQEFAKEKIYSKATLVWTLESIRYASTVYEVAVSALHRIKEGEVKLEYPLPEISIAAKEREK